MKTTTTVLGALGAVLLSAVTGCTAATAEEVETSADQAVTSAPAAGGVEMYIGWQVREEIGAALGDPDGEGMFGDVVVPGLLRVQHQYSVAVLRLETPSWALVTGLTPPDVGSWSIDSSLGVTFPRWSVRDDADQAASLAAAKKLFGALTKAVETTAVEHGATVTTRRSEHGSLSCTKRARAGRPDEFQCTVSGVGQVGGSGLLWSWDLAEEKAAEDAADTK